MRNKLKIILLSIFHVAFLCACTAHVHEQDTVKQKRPVIIDTDMAIDDWTAVLYTLQHPTTKVVAITVTGAGETYCKEGLENVMHLIYLADKLDENIPVACGDSEPMDGYNVFPQPWRDEANSLFDLPKPKNLPAALSEHAVPFLNRTLTQASEPIDIIALGNLTNIAQLILEYPQALNNLGELFIMGGAYNAKGNIIVPGFTDDNLNKVAEWNIYVDPLAAKIVFDSDVNKTIVPLDATNEVRVTHDFAKRLKARAKSKAALFQDQILDRNKGFISSNEYYFWDVLTAVYALDSSICQFESHFTSVNVDTADHAGPNEQAPYPATRYGGKARQTLDPEVAGQTIKVATGNGRKAKICVRPNAERFEELLIQGLNASL